MKKFAGSMLTGVLAFGLVGGGTALADSHDTDDGSSEDTGMVRIVHASPDAPEVDVYVDGEAVVEGAAFKDATDYLEVPEGEREVEIFAAGENGEGDPVLAGTLDVEDGEAYTAAATNTLEELELTVLEDKQDTAEGMADVRVAHFSPDAPNVDVAVTDGDILFEDAPFTGVTDYLEVEAGSYDLEVRPAGTEDVVLDLAGTELEEGMSYSVLAVGFAEGDPALDAIVLATPSSDSMPSEMPQTGSGGTDNTMMYVLAGLMAAGLGAGYYVRRRAGASS
ncbi:uncharacterized protein DUF4397 [Sinobaca qinghaiensis]|uniref:Uncharacterized protein DUF4397 n=1 Tax=Sinobaca qinghaiensis TaxID=342944 RepID=A0A419V8U8_9BACL|nr:DUF4397 domain-containing protein [Sinobaca qinghaiensis]RKD76430.1 uncharacterized protein DUF4397 [Sinobaca qinghaiensis]